MIARGSDGTVFVVLGSVDDYGESLGSFSVRMVMLAIQSSAAGATRR